MGSASAPEVFPDLLADFHVDSAFVVVRNEIYIFGGWNTGKDTV